MSNCYSFLVIEDSVERVRSLLRTGHEIIVHGILVELAGIKQGLRSLPEQLLHF